MAIRRLPTNAPLNAAGTAITQLQNPVHVQAMERTAVIDANGAYVAGVHVLEGRRTGHPCADHRGARPVNPVILEVHIRDRVKVFYGEITAQHA
jgi:hypothetical protein